MVYSYTPTQLKLANTHHQSVYEDQIDCFWCSQLIHVGLDMSYQAVIFPLVWLILNFVLWNVQSTQGTQE